jgi:hypothetical protein
MPSPSQGVLILNQFLTMQYNNGLTAAPASPLSGSPVCRGQCYYKLVYFGLQSEVLSFFLFR